MQNKAYIIEVATYNKGKLTDDSGFIPQCYMDKELVERAVRIKARNIYSAIPAKNKPRFKSQFNSDAIFKGGVRVYFKDGYTEIKPFELNIIADLNEVLKEVNGNK